MSHGYDLPAMTIFVKNPLLAGTMAGWLGIKFLFIF
jgi:hypothetical protein